jgi:hypothetical protein
LTLTIRKNVGAWLITGQKAVIVLAIILITFLAFIGEATAQASKSSSSQSASPPSLIAISAAQLSFYGQQGQGSIDRSINIVGLVNQPIDVTVFPVELVNNSTGTIIPPSDMQIANFSFTVSKNALETVTISLKTAKAQVGTYQGTILVTASSSASNATVSTISITAKIDIWKPLYIMYFFITGIFISFALSLFMGLIVLPAQKTKARVKAKTSIENKRNERKERPISELKYEDAEKLIQEEISKMANIEIEQHKNTTFEHTKFFAKKKLAGSAKFWSIFCGLIAVFLWVILNTLPGNSFTSTSGLLSSAIIVPLVGYLIGLISNKTGDAQPKKAA